MQALFIYSYHYSFFMFSSDVLSKNKLCKQMLVRPKERKLSK